MDDNKNLILATVLSFLVIVGWYTFLPPEVPQQPAQVAQTTATTAEPATTPEPQVAVDPTVANAARLTIETEALSGSISMAGGRLDDLLLNKYPDSLGSTEKVRLLSPVGQEANKPYYAVYGWTPAGALDAAAVPSPATLWTIEKGDKLTPTSPVRLKWDNGAGLVFYRDISIDDKYLFTITETVENKGASAVRLAPYGIVARHGKPDGTAFYVLHEGAIRMTDGTREEVTYKNMTKLDELPVEGQAAVQEVQQTGWVGITDKYWMATIAPLAEQPFTSVVKYFAPTDTYQVEARMPAVDVAAGASASVTTRLFAGAKEWETITGYEDSAKIDRFEDSIDWGWFFYFTKPMFWLLHTLHGMIGNMGLAIIALTIVIKLLVFPLARTSYISMARMKELQPELEALKASAGDDKMKLQKDMIELYKKNKVNPAAGCLPMFIQIPIFFSLYKVIFVTIELRHAPFFGWIKDLSAPDPSSILNLFGLLPWATPEHGSIFFIFSLGVLPILLGISMWFQQKLNPSPTDPAQKAIFAWMPWIFMFMLGSFASGLVLYWIVNNTITFLQQYTIMSIHHKRPDIFGNILEGFRKPADKK